MIDFTKDSVITISEAAKVAGVTEETITNWTTEGACGRKLDSCKMGGLRRTSLEAINRFIVQRGDAADAAKKSPPNRKHRGEQAAADVDGMPRLSIKSV